jgi:predicted unusual protein kinase regulating ubiquinone biosynthesis (AarF/ABC1/UbiB family)
MSSSPLSKAPARALPAPATPREEDAVVYRASSVSRWRFLRAYATTFRVIWSYSWLGLVSRFRGSDWRDQHIVGVHTRNARRVYGTILELQGLFIKVGQLLSIMANFLPEEFRAELEGLQDQVPPRPYEEIESRIEQELGAKVADLFADIHRRPIASASLGQVHEARLKDGRRVCVKVQHSDIDTIVRLDLRTIRRILRIVEWFVPVKGFDAHYHQIRELLQQELDFNREADSIERIAKNFAGDPKVVFPTPIRSHSRLRVLTTTFLEGKKANDLVGIDAMGVDRKDIAKRLVRAYCQMIFVDGVYHADPHPGNLLVGADGSLILLDFGAVAELSTQMREGIPELLEGVLRRDTPRLIKAMKKMGFLSRTTDEEMSERIVEYFHARFQEEVKLESFNLKDIKVDPARGLESLLDLRRMNIGLKELSGTFQIPKDLVLLERTLLLLYGCCSVLDADLNPLGIIQPYIQDFVLGNRDFTQIAIEAVRDAAMTAVTLPEEVHRYLKRAQRGQIEIRVRGVQEGARAVYAVGRQIIYASAAMFAAYEGLQMYLTGHPQLMRACFGIAIFAAVLLLGSSIFARPKRGARW